MKILKLLFLPMAISMNAFAQPIFTRAEIDYIFTGYPDGSIAFTVIGESVNPANCQNSGGYVMKNDHDTKSALSVLLAAKMADQAVFFSVLDNVCHEPSQTDSPGTFPVIQRIAIK